MSRMSGTKRRRHKNIQRRAQISKARARDITSRLRVNCTGSAEEVRFKLKLEQHKATMLHEINMLMEKLELHTEREYYDFKNRIKKRLTRVEKYAEKTIKERELQSR